MSSSAGLSSYSSLFASGLHPSGRLQAATSKDVYAYPFQRIPYGLKDFPTNVDNRRPSADTESTGSRRSSLPTFASARRMGQNNSYYAPIQQSAATAASPSAIAFTPSILLRSETTATKRSDLKSFLSMDANDPTQQLVVPPLSSNLHNHTSPPRVSQNQRPHGRAVSANSSKWAPSVLQSPNTSNYSPNFDSDRHSVAGPFGGTPSISEAHSMRRSMSAPSREDHNSTSLQRTESVHSSDNPPRLEVRLDPKASRISFDPSSPDVNRIASLASEAPPTPSPSIPARPEYNPRVRSSLPASSIGSALPPVPPRSIQRNMSVTSASTFVSSTPSQRSAIRRVRRNEALARLEGNYYDPAPEVQASGSFMPFESEDEEEESEMDRRSRRDVLSSRAKSPPPPTIKPPSPLRHRNNEQCRFVEIEATESLFELALSTIAEVPIPSTPQKDTGFSPDSRGPMIRVQESMWPSFDEEDEENVTPSASSRHHKVSMNSRTPLVASPFSSHINLTAHTANKSSTSLASFTPFSSTDFNRTRTGSIHQHTHGTGSGSQYATPTGSKPDSGSDSIVTRDSLSIRSNDAASDESVGPGSVGPGIGSIIRNMDPHAGSHRGQDRTRGRSGSISRATPHYIKATAAAPLALAPSDAQKGTRMRDPSSAVTPTTPKPNKSSKHREKEASNTKSRDAKGKEGKIRYETYLDMSGDEKYVRDGAKKRRWLFGK